MSRYSENVKKVIELIWFRSQLDEAKNIIATMSEPSERLLAKIWLWIFYHSYSFVNQFLELGDGIKRENEISENPYVNFYLNAVYHMYYHGWGAPRPNKELENQYYNQLKTSFDTFPFNDEIEEHLISGVYYFNKAIHTPGKVPALVGNSQYLEQAIKHFSYAADRSLYFSEFQLWLIISTVFKGRLEVSTGEMQIAIKTFENAEKLANTINKQNEGEFFYRVEIFNEISYWYYLQGDLETAIEYIRKCLKIARSVEIVPAYIYANMSTLAAYYFEQEKFELSLELREQSLQTRKQYADQIDPFHLFAGHFYLFYFYYQRYEMTEEESFHQRAHAELAEMTQIYDLNQDDIAIKQYRDLASALLLKHGNLRKKVQAMDIFEELMQSNINDPRIPLNLLELLFEDYMITTDEDTLERIVDIFEKIKEDPLRHDPKVIFPYLSQQILIAKFEYYIRGDIEEALNTLYQTKELIEGYQLSNLISKLNQEISILEREVTKWDEIDLSVKKRINKSKFTNYIRDALDMTNE